MSYAKNNNKLSAKNIALLLLVFFCATQAKIEHVPKALEKLLGENQEKTADICKEVTAEEKEKNLDRALLRRLSKYEILEGVVDFPQEIAIAICREVMENNHSENTYYPTNYLLCGVPGTGRSNSTIASSRKLYEEIGAGVLFVSGSSFNTKYSGQGTERVRALMNEAKKRTQQGTKPVFICIDEIDALGSNDTTDKGCSVSQSQTINELLTQISLIQKQYPIYIIATTNHEKSLGNALLRRFEKYEVNKPWRVKAEEDMKMFDCIKQVKKASGVSYAEAEEIFRKQTGYEGSRMFGKEEK